MTHSSKVIILRKKNPVDRSFVLSRTPIEPVTYAEVGNLKLFSVEEI